MSESEMTSDEVRLLLTGFALAMALVPVKAFAFATVWEWHVVRLGAPPIGAATAFGLLCLVGLVKPSTIRDTSHEAPMSNAQVARTNWRRTMAAWASTAFLFAGAWVVAMMRGDA